ncbi:MAG TPA: aspartate/glutamate racemase family protein, partial [Devosia sp.]|nr:aspartate/glutamate racemase family protein [Devosia sp.]
MHGGNFTPCHPGERSMTIPSSVPPGGDEPFIGVLMLDTQFVRFPGDIGHAASWQTPVRFKTVRGAQPAQVVYGRAAGLLEPFIAAGLELVDQGARAITTSCGFLALFQRELSEALPVPVFTSSLLQIPMIEKSLPETKRVGILTFSAKALSAEHLRAVGVATDTPIQGLPAESLFVRYYGNQPCNADMAVFDMEVAAAARSLIARHPEIGAIVCECTNLPRHAPAIARATALPVFHVMSMMHWLGQSLLAQEF